VKTAPGAIEFPALYVNPIETGLFQDHAQLSRAPAKGLRDGWYEKMRLIDPAGREWKVHAKSVLGPAGGFFGFDKFMIRWVRVDLELACKREEVPLEELVELVGRWLREREGFASREDFDALKAKVRAARSTAELFELVRDREYS
jgi:hypothetical protein